MDRKRNRAPREAAQIIPTSQQAAALRARHPVIGREQVILGAGLCLLLLMFALAVYNVGAYLAAGQVLLASVALASELIGFVMAVVVEIAWRDGRKVEAVVCGLILAACAAFNIIGTEHAYARDIALKADHERQQAQSLLDGQRAEALDAVTRAEAAIQRYDYLLPDPDTNAYRQRQARENWEGATSADRASRDRAQAELDRLPVIAEAPPPDHPYDASATAAGAGVAEVIKVLGLWACGFGALAMGLGETPGRGREPLGNETSRKATGGNARRRNGETLAEYVRRLRFQARLSYGQIEKLSGVRKGTAWKWCNGPSFCAPSLLPS